MANKMLIDATHPEETRVVVLRGNRVEEFDFESASRRQLRGNIYLAKVTRVEPSLQAAFIDYGGNRHGFLAFSEIHPDYYQIPVADRQALIDEEERAHRDAEAEADRRADMRQKPGRRRAAAGRRGSRAERVSSEPVADVLEHHEAGDDDQHRPDPDHTHPGDAHSEDAHSEDAHSEDAHAVEADHADEAPVHDSHDDEAPHEAHGDDHASDQHPGDDHRDDDHFPADAANGEHPDEAHDHAAGFGHADEDDDEPFGSALNGGAEETGVSLVPYSGDPVSAGLHAEALNGRSAAADHDADDGHDDDQGGDDEEEIVESVGGDDALEEVPDRAPRHRRQYKIQEVIKRRQIMLVQVVKEERGTKGAALTTYLSLAGRYSVLMPNTARGGGISRKITNVIDRRRLKEIAQDLEVPEGMGIILRTAGAARTKTEIKRDFEYLLRAWETVRDLTLNSTAPTLVYEEGSLVKRSIRDLYNKDIDEVVVAGEDAYKDARDFMRMLMPSHAKNVRPYHDNQPILARFGIESQLDAMFSPVVQLRSGGYIVINQTEALVAIDVNSGRATREHHIEDTALKTNLEASEEISRQLRLRDLAGLIVIDFIDMDEKRNNRAVERRLKDCLKNDRARIQVGRISHFGLLEMSRQRIRTSVLESSTDKCPHCGGTGHVRSVSSVALQLLRMIEETLQRGATHNIVGRTRSEIALYVLNHKRAHLHDLEHRFQIAVTVVSDDTISGQLPFVIEKGEQVHTMEQARAIAAHAAAAIPVALEDTVDALDSVVDADLDDVDDDDDGVDAEAEGEETEGRGGRRRRRRRRGGRRDRVEDGAREEAQASEDGDGEPLGDSFEGAEDRAAQEQPSYHTPVGDEDLEAAGDGDAEPGEDDDGRGEGGDGRRRRRRGRRGGRRTRREAGDAVPPEHAVAPIEDEVVRAVADFGGAPVELTIEETTDETAEETSGYGHEGTPGPVAADDEAGHEPEVAPLAVAVAKPKPEPEARPEAVSKPAAPRRRSTVREPAPFVVSGGGIAPGVPPVSPAPAPVTPHSAVSETVTSEPAASDDGAATAEPATEEAPQPRRAGWWAKRVLGDKG